MSAQQTQIALRFDTTGSMRPCIAQVRTRVEGIFAPLLKEVPKLTISLGANGDYCDRGSTYVTHAIDFTNDLHALAQFVRNVGPTDGGDLPECYELVLHEARDLSWAVNANKILVVIADDVPHPPSYSGNTKRLDWREEVRQLQVMGVVIYSVQCLSRLYASSFYREMAEMTGGYHLTLDQFSEVPDLIMGIGMMQAGPERFARFEEEIARDRRMSRTLDHSFGTMAGRKSSRRFERVAPGLEPVSPGRFQILPVLSDIDIRGFVEGNDLVYVAGRGFYEFTKTETIQEAKEVVLRDKRTGDMFTGAKAREMIGLPYGVRGRIRPTAFEQFDVFVQSTSYNRKLKGGTRFLYEVATDR